LTGQLGPHLTSWKPTEPAHTLITRRLCEPPRKVFGSFPVTPFAAVQFAELWQNGFIEINPVSAGAAGRSA
jgi:hypothetical protein